MKKILVSFALILGTLTGFGQRLKTVKLDSVVSVSLPPDFHQTDTLGQQSYTAEARYGYIMISRSPNPPGNKTLKKEKELNNVFTEYIRKVQSSLTDGRIVHDHDTIINNLEVREFTLRTDTGSGVQLRKFRILYTKPVTYTFQYLYDELHKDIAAGEIRSFFESIKIAPALSGKDQFMFYGKPGHVNILAVIVIAVGVIIVVLAILLVRRKRRRDILLNDVIKKE